MFHSSQAAELKAQGVEEAARDPNSKVTSADAQKVMADESKKAGIAAYTFDPNASPEEKAAAARAVRASDLPDLTIATDCLPTERTGELPPYQAACCSWSCDRHSELPELQPIES